MIANFIFFLVGMLLGIVFHEGGHWLACGLLRVPVHSVSIGTGRVLARRRIGSTAFELRQLHIMGEVRHAALLPLNRLTHVLICLGGPLGNATVIGLAALATAVLGTDRVEVVAPGIVLAQLFLIALNLLPLRGKWGKSDGYQIVETLIRGTKPWVEEGRRFYASILRPYASGAPASYSKTSCRIFYARTMLEIGDRRDAAQALLEELEQDEIRPDETLLILDSLVRAQVSHDVGLAPRLDELSARAVQLGANVATVRGSRGVALLAMGRYDEGQAMLEPVLASVPSLEQVLALLYLARADEARGDLAAAIRRLDAAEAALRTLPDVQKIFALVARTRAAFLADKENRVAAA